MSLLLPLGLLGLAAIIILIIIYIIKPNYQNKYVSSTFVWKLSVKYKKKKIPLNKLRNLLILLCQILILTACALMIAKPVNIIKNRVDQTEYIAIIDSSASMRTQTDNESRFERAVNNVRDLSRDLMERNGILTIIVADATPSYLVVESDEDDLKFVAVRTTNENAEQIDNALKSLIYEEELVCSYGQADIDGAMVLCREVLDENPDAAIKIFTDSNYAFVPSGVEIVNVAKQSEWNAAILNAYSAIEDNYYSFYVDTACYGRDMELVIDLEVYGPNGTSAQNVIQLSANVYCDRDKTKNIIFKNEPSDSDVMQNPDYDNNDDIVTVYIPNESRITSYDYIHISVKEDDSFNQDNDFYIYGGKKEVIKVQYASTLINPFFRGALYTLLSRYVNTWDIQITEVREKRLAATTGYDFYIFEHMTPESMPTDGVVFLADPEEGVNSSGLGLRVNNTLRVQIEDNFLVQEEYHSILKNIRADYISVTQIKEIKVEDTDYKTLMSFGGLPILLLRDEPDTKTIVMAFSLHYSNFALLMDFPLMMYNIFEHFLPTTVKGNAFEVNQEIELDARGESLVITSGSGFNMTYDEFPSKLNVTLPGTYELTQLPFGKPESAMVTERIYVKIPADESNIHKVEETVAYPEVFRDGKDYYKNLIEYFAWALVALLFAEWVLHLRDIV